MAASCCCATVACAFEEKPPLDPHEVSTRFPLLSGSLFIINWNCFLEAKLILWSLPGPHPHWPVCVTSFCCLLPPPGLPQVPAIPGPWVLEPCALSHTAVEQTPSPSFSLGLWSLAQFKFLFLCEGSPLDPLQQWNLSSSEPPGAHWACPIFLPSPHLVFQSSGSWFCPSSRWSAYQHGDCTWILKLQHLPQCLAYNRNSIQ